jgi:hypothetical protein
MTDRPIEELEAGHEFRETLIPRADDQANLMWHGWAIMDAFLAGIDWARKQQSSDTRRKGREAK